MEGEYLKRVRMFSVRLAIVVQWVSDRETGCTVGAFQVRRRMSDQQRPARLAIYLHSTQLHLRLGHRISIPPAFLPN